MSKKCCGKCSMTDGCRIFIDMVNAEGSLALIDATFETLFKWYDGRSAGWKKRANPKMWAEIRRQWKECV